ncbi:hypothetical protein [Streptomyces sp. ML-6]|uniref:hypothetical protein n=1 Tax=unclassified Streptomyces TaxID=2593676 RepID=UPI0024BF4EAE|nr:hypothetical protein [Streptomyces sp. ML-6]MDK0521834.1 hypothetical protein [Streptomyces sp. ML-6]
MAMSDEQGEIVGKVFRGDHTARDVERLTSNFRHWLDEEWAGNEARSVASCLHALAEGCGDEWEAMTQRDWSAHIWFFSLHCPRPVTYSSLVSDAYEYRDAILSCPGGFSAFAVMIRKLRGEPE